MSKYPGKIMMDAESGEISGSMPSTAHNVVTDIVRVHPDALRVPFDQVRAGDWVFDTFGGRHKLVRARVLKNGKLSIKRDDYPHTEHVNTEDSTITIVPEHGWTYEGHGYRSVYENDKRVGGEFYETCRCGATFGSGTGGDESYADELLRQHADEANGREFYCG